MMKKSETIVELSKAFAKMQKELEQPFKNANNPFFKSKYVPLENVVDSITKASSKHGLSFTQFPSSDENGNVTVGTMVMHESGISIHAPMWGATKHLDSQQRKYKFQSTHPCGVRRQLTATVRVKMEFQSTHPCGVRPKLIF